VIVISNTGPASAPPPETGILVCGASNHQRDPQIVSDGLGGMYVAWVDERAGNTDIYAQHVDGTGAALWPTNGILVKSGTTQQLIDVVSDGSHGVIIVWLYEPDRIRVQRLDTTGSEQWTAGGADVQCSNDAVDMVAVGDGDGGVILAWSEQRSADYDIYAQKVDYRGFEVWPSGGVTVFTSGVDDVKPDIDCDGSGGALIAAEVGTDVRAQRVFASSGVWIAAGRLVSDGSPADPSAPAICNDGVGGAYVAWHELEGSGGNTGIRARRVDPGGTVQWASPAVVSSADYIQQDADVITVGPGNAVVCWETEGIDAWDVYAQKIDAYGSALWTVDGVYVCAESGEQVDPVIAGTNGSDVVIGFLNREHGDVLYAQKINSSGGMEWVPEGVFVLSGEMVASGYDFGYDGAGGLLATTAEDRLMNGYDIYAQPINSLGGIYAPAPEIRGIADVPGDQGGWVRITIGPSDRDQVDAEQPCARYDVWQRIDGSAAPAILQAAAGAEPVTGGVWRVEADGRKLLVAGPEAIVPEGSWELVGSFAAAQDTQYTYRASTLADSSDAGTPWATYFVSAHTTDPRVWFASDADSGYSVDNIPPQVPTGFSVAYNTGSGNHLTWDVCPDNDFDYFRVYRDDSPGFTPGTGNLVHSTAGTEWLNTESEGWKYHYKITAVDDAGNESAWTSGTATAVQASQAPAEFALLHNAPNPFNPSTTVYFDVPERALLELAVYDVQGRRVRTLARGSFDPGRRHVRWDGRDDRGNPVASGVYMYRLIAPSYTESKKMILLR
jgi:hypothetical protein